VNKEHLLFAGSWVPETRDAALADAAGNDKTRSDICRGVVDEGCDSDSNICNRITAGTIFVIEHAVLCTKDYKATEGHLPFLTSLDGLSKEDGDAVSLVTIASYGHLSSRWGKVAADPAIRAGRGAATAAVVEEELKSSKAGKGKGAGPEQEARGGERLRGNEKRDAETLAETRPVDREVEVVYA
jgi:hypothetical protein